MEFSADSPCTSGWDSSSSASLDPQFPAFCVSRNPQMGLPLSGAWGLALTLSPSPSAQEDHLSTAKTASVHETYFTIS